MGSLKGLSFGVCLVLLVGVAAAAANGGLQIGGLDIDYKCEEGHETTVMDKELAQVALNLEYFEAEYFLWGSVGYGLDKEAPHLADGGPAPIGAQQANLDEYYKDIFYQMGLQEVGHLRAIKTALGDAPSCAFPRTQLDISKKTWAETMDKAFMAKFGKKLSPSFDPYEDSLKYLISTYTIPYVGLTGYVGANPLLKGYEAKKLVAGLLGVESGQDAVIRTEMYKIKDMKVAPYDYTVADFSEAISTLRNKASNDHVDEGLVVPKKNGAEGKVSGNILAGNKDSLAYSRTPVQVFATVYGTGDASQPGGFFPKGAQGVIAAQLRLKEGSYYEEL
ncbi:hypothetical protein M758_2G114300 [Ceratodon purpureus]|nr:hypothetical protein M758_2G114300 [Ceratodon purpureus]